MKSVIFTDTMPVEAGVLEARVKGCDAVVASPNWGASAADCEVLRLANTHGKPVYVGCLKEFATWLDTRCEQK